MDQGLRNYLIVTAGYWAFTVTDGAIRMLVVLLVTAVLLPSGAGKMKSKPKFTQVFSKIPAINWLSAARFFLFGSRDVWFVVGLPEIKLEAGTSSGTNSV